MSEENFKFTIHKYVPIPKAKNLLKSYLSDEIQMLVNNMKTGECIDAPNLKLATSVANLINRIGSKSHDNFYFKAVTRKLKNENDVVFWRIWKIKK